MAITFELGVDSSTAIQLYPEYDYKDAEKLIETRHRTQSGRQFSYKYGDYEHFEFNLNYIPSSEATVINSWWQSRAELLYFISSGGGTDVYSVMLMNNEKPLGQFNRPYDAYRKGKLILESY